MAFKDGHQVRHKMPPQKQQVTEMEEVEYETLMTTTKSAILFTFEIIDSKHHKQLVDKWLPKKFIRVDEENKIVAVAKWIYQREWGYKG